MLNYFSIGKTIKVSITFDEISRNEKKELLRALLDDLGFTEALMSNTSKNPMDIINECFKS